MSLPQNTTTLIELENNLENLEHEMDALIQDQQSWGLLSSESSSVDDFTKDITEYFHQINIASDFNRHQQEPLASLNHDVENILDYINSVQRQTENMKDISNHINNIKELSYHLEEELKDPDTLMNDISSQKILSHENTLDILNYRIAALLLRTQNLTKSPILEIESLHKKVEDFNTYSQPS
ncbi:MAG TPA: hypothetical protein QF353_04145 [Gammaproteobacteria bacterium]|nr:hypothetical protein [Gammaproteobacteria bacterium]